MANIRLGLIGCGGIAAAHAGAADAAGVSIVAVVDPVESARSAMAERTGARGFASIEELLAARAAGERDAAVDALVVCTPPSVRRAVVESALRGGLGVLVEKPLAHTPADAAALVALAEQFPQLPTAVAYCHRFTPALVEMQRRLDAGQLGRPVRFENVFACWHPTLRDKWMSDPAISGGGSLIDTGCHSLDLFGFLFGGTPRLRIEAALLHHGWADRGDTNATILAAADLTGRPYAEPANGHGPPAIAGVIAAGWAEQERFTVRVVGTEGALDYDFVAAPQTLRFTPSQGPAENIPVEPHDLRFARQLEAFAAKVRDPDTPTNLASFAEAARVAELVDAAYAKAQPIQSADAPLATPAPAVTVHARTPAAPTRTATA